MNEAQHLPLLLSEHVNDPIQFVPRTLNVVQPVFPMLFHLLSSPKAAPSDARQPLCDRLQTVLTPANQLIATFPQELSEEFSSTLR